jgi:hypothetical protein
LVAEVNPSPGSELAMSDDNLLPFSLPAVQRKKITAAFDGGRIISNAASWLARQSVGSASPTGSPR